LQWYAGKIKDAGDKEKWIIKDVDGGEHEGLDGKGVDQKHLRFVETKVEAAGGVLFIDEAHELQPLGTGGREGKAILNAIMQAAEEHRDKVRHSCMDTKYSTVTQFIGQHHSRWLQRQS
jgi:hypothetical protein